MATYNIDVSDGEHVVASGGTLNEWFGKSWPKPSAENAVSGDTNYNDMILVATKAG